MISFDEGVGSTELRQASFRVLAGTPLILSCRYELGLFSTSLRFSVYARGSLPGNNLTESYQTYEIYDDDWRKYTCIAVNVTSSMEDNITIVAMVEKTRFTSEPAVLAVVKIQEIGQEPCRFLTSADNAKIDHTGYDVPKAFPQSEFVSLIYKHHRGEISSQSNVKLYRELSE